MFDAAVAFRFFDRGDEILITERDALPHWGQAGTVCFITWRTWDSMPRAIVEKWLAERRRWLERHGIDPDAVDWRDRLEALTPAQRKDFHRRLTIRWEDALDACHGACVLRRADLAQVVADSLRYFDGERYALSDFVVMPNHVHLLAAFPSAEAMLLQCESWKHYTGVQINQALGRQGRFWQTDGFDHLVRGPEHFEGLRRYIAANPSRAKLRSGEYLHYPREALEEPAPAERAPHH
jgi:REP element-mobilizing transposase RayT